MGTFRPQQPTSTDRSAGDRARHRQKVRSSIVDNIADIIAEESIIGRDGDQIVKVPLRGIKEYRFVYEQNSPGVAQNGGEEVQRGDKLGKGKPSGQGNEPGKPGQKPGEGGDQPGVDYYETDVSLNELIDMMFEDLDLPRMERKPLARIESERNTRRKGYRRVGLRVHLDKRKTAKERIKRQLLGQKTGKAGPPTSRAALKSSGDSPPRTPYSVHDLRYRHRTTEIHRESNAVVLCIMDTSGSMDKTKKYLARSFFFLLYQFVYRRYENVDVVFIAHDIEAREVTEDDFFHKGESGGTFVSSGYNKAMEIIADRYHPELWNVYAFHCSDGDNFGSDTPRAIKAAKELCDVCNLFGYGEIKPRGAGFYGSSLIETFQQIGAENFERVLIERKEDVWPSFKAFLEGDTQKAAAEAS